MLKYQKKPLKKAQEELENKQISNPLRLTLASAIIYAMEEPGLVDSEIREYYDDYINDGTLFRQIVSDSLMYSGYADKKVCKVLLSLHKENGFDISFAKEFMPNNEYGKILQTD